MAGSFRNATEKSSDPSYRDGSDGLPCPGLGVAIRSTLEGERRGFGGMHSHLSIREIEAPIEAKVPT